MIEAEKPGGTIIPIIISSDKTQVTLFRNKSAYPVYLTIGNIPKSIRRKPSRHAQVLLGYLPTCHLEHITNHASRRRALANLFHACMTRIMQPLVEVGLEGVAMTSGDGVSWRCHPIFATFVGDYPEQILATGVKTGECPECEVLRDELGDGGHYQYRDLELILHALSAIDDPDAQVFIRACKDAGIKPVVHPFWEKLPYSNIYCSIAPDILHQLHQGVIKHLVSWLKNAFGEVEIDTQCHRFPPNHNIHLFMKGITSLSRLSGTEHSQICQLLLGLVVNLRLPDGMNPACLICAVQALLDFLYLAQYPVHSNVTLDLLADALTHFHDNKNIFVDLGIREHFNIPKLHFLQHYVDFIMLQGTTDNYSTEYTERLHIDLAKDAFRATN